MFTVRACLLWLIVLLTLFYILCCRCLLGRIVYLFSGWFDFIAFCGFGLLVAR